jgi:hypothetical protein
VQGPTARIRPSGLDGLDSLRVAAEFSRAIMSDVSFPHHR